MASRREVNQQRIAMSQALREQCREGRLMPGQAAPSLRQLAEDYSVSTRVANQVLQDLISEGLFHMVPRVGTFVGRPQSPAGEFYLMLLPDQFGLTAREDLVQIQYGFEERIAERGSASMVMPLRRALASRAAREMPTLTGVFDMAWHDKLADSWGTQGNVARVGFSGRVEDPQNSDEISYDDEGGGRLAARHLIDLGHQHIAFLALHTESGTAGELIWSQQREAGWRQAMSVSRLNAGNLAFHPSALQHESEEQIAVGREVGRQILAHREITAVIAANDYAAAGFLEAARASGIPPERWPAVVGFDNRALSNGHLLTSLRLPAEQLGRVAADLLWERRNGQLTGEPVHRRVAMRLIPRLTSRRDWSQNVANTLLTPQLTVSVG